MSNDQVRKQLENRLLEAKARLAKTQDADEEERLLNELLYLQGAVAALDYRDGRGHQLLRSLQGGKR